MTENANTNVFELISSQYYDLTTAEKKIADLIISDPEYVQQTGISDLAEACGIGVRLASSVICSLENTCPRFLPSEFGFNV